MLHFVHSINMFKSPAKIALWWNHMLMYQHLGIDAYMREPWCVTVWCCWKTLGSPNHNISLLRFIIFSTTFIYSLDSNIMNCSYWSYFILFISYISMFKSPAKIALWWNHISMYDVLNLPRLGASVSSSCLLWFNLHVYEQLLLFFNGFNKRLHPTCTLTPHTHHGCRASRSTQN